MEGQAGGAGDAAPDSNGIAVGRQAAGNSLMTALGRGQGEAPGIAAEGGGNIDTGNIGVQGKGLVVAHLESRRGQGGKAAGGFGDCGVGGSGGYYRAAGIAFPQLRRHRPALGRYRIAGYLAGVQGETNRMAVSRGIKTGSRQVIAQIVETKDAALAARKGNGIGLMQGQVGKGYAESVGVPGDVGAGQAGDGDARVGKFHLRRPIAPVPAGILLRGIPAVAPLGLVPIAPPHTPESFRRLTVQLLLIVDIFAGELVQVMQLELVVVDGFRAAGIGQLQLSVLAGYRAETQVGGRPQGRRRPGNGDGISSGGVAGSGNRNGNPVFRADN